MARGVAPCFRVMAARTLLLRSWVAAGLGCLPAVVSSSTLGAAPSAVPRAGSVHAAPSGAEHGADDEGGRGVDSPRPADRRRALRTLASEGSPAAWRRVFALLADPESEVGDDAQLLLSRIEESAVAAELAGKAGLGSKEVGVRLRAAEGLGRVACAVRVEALLAAVDDREAEVAHLALWSLERCAHARRLEGDLERAAGALEHAARSHRDGLVRASAVAARAALLAKSPHAADEREGFDRLLGRCREDRDARVRCASALAARELEPARALALAAALARDAETSVRLARIELLERIACKPSAVALIAALTEETFPRARTSIVQALQRLSGFKHREDPRPWRDWARDLPEDWRPTLMPSYGEPGRDSNAGGGEAAGGEARTMASTSFVGLPLTSQRVCFAIDFSGSMWTPMPDGRMPKELVDARLRSTLESLPSSTQFNIVPFTNDVLPWRPKLVQATVGNVRAAIADFEKCQARGRGNFYDAAVFALDDPEVDTLLTLTDGVPTGGFHSDLELVFPLLQERNRFRRVAFDTVLVDAPAAAERRWRLLSRDSGGRLVAVDKAE
jgi:hypothetical protein